ncbi:hypothetical protein [Shinella sp.]|uniref:hypothetical protein n=1 Tax=Shinella sp. TaxID=1870904 RepID=UPI002589A631|nr:hypothetical protein [Shinella sp.]
MTGKKQISLLISAIAFRRPINFHKTLSSTILLPSAPPEVVAGFMWISMRACGAAENIQAHKGMKGGSPYGEARRVGGSRQPRPAVHPPGEPSRGETCVIVFDHYLLNDLHP